MPHDDVKVLTSGRLCHCAGCCLTAVAANVAVCQCEMKCSEHSGRYCSQECHMADETITIALLIVLCVYAHCRRVCVRIRRHSRRISVRVRRFFPPRFTCSVAIAIVEARLIDVHVICYNRKVKNMNRVRKRLGPMRPFAAARSA